MTGSKVTIEEKDQYVHYRQMGAGIVEAAKRVGRSRAWAHRFETEILRPEVKATFPTNKAAHRKAELVQRPVADGELCEEAKRSLEDFEFFRRRYFGHVSTPWQVEAAETLLELLESPEDEYVVLNVPPGGGKTTLFTCDIPAWLICRNRSVRVLLGHRVQARATEYSGRLRSAFTRRTPFRADPRKVALGLAVDAESTMANDFGPFKPNAGDELWRRDQFTVIQDDDVRTDEKESTVVGFGMDSGQLGYRADYIVWDDLFSKKIKTEESIEAQREWYDDEAETRLEPGGVFALVAQRLAANDISRYCLDKGIPQEASEDDEDSEFDDDAEQSSRVYRHIVYQAHDESACEGNHGLDDPPYPGHRAEPNGGCLLDPRRLSWKRLRKKMENGSNFRVVYQQEDVDPDEVLVPKVWVEGGRDPLTGEVFAGCWDTERALATLPKGLRPPLVSVAVADPSPTKFWAVEWIVYQPATGFRFLMDLLRVKMSAPEFLDWNEREQSFSGVMETWQERSKRLGVPIGWWVVEQNAAQRFILQYDHFRRWQQRTGVRVIGHDTNTNKADPEFGLSASLKPIFRRGLIRLPGYQQDSVSRPASLKLVNEATRYPSSTTDDTLMALWFFEFNRRRFETTPLERQPKKWLPGFVRSAA